MRPGRAVGGGGSFANVVSHAEWLTGQPLTHPVLSISLISTCMMFDKKMMMMMVLFRQTFSLCRSSFARKTTTQAAFIN